MYLQFDWPLVDLDAALWNRPLFASWQVAPYSKVLPVKEQACVPSPTQDRIHVTHERSALPCREHCISGVEAFLGQSHEVHSVFRNEGGKEEMP